MLHKTKILKGKCIAIAVIARDGFQVNTSVKYRTGPGPGLQGLEMRNIYGKMTAKKI